MKISSGIVAIVLMATPFSNLKASSEMKNVVFSICSQSKNRCLEVKSPSMAGTDWAPLFAFGRNSQVTLWRKNFRNENFVAQSGYFDWSIHRIVLTQKIGNQLVERTFSTDTLVEF